MGTLVEPWHSNERAGIIRDNHGRDPLAPVYPIRLYHPDGRIDEYRGINMTLYPYNYNHWPRSMEFPSVHP